MSPLLRPMAVGSAWARARTVSRNAGTLGCDARRKTSRRASRIVPSSAWQRAFRVALAIARPSCSSVLGAHFKNTRMALRLALTLGVSCVAGDAMAESSRASFTAVKSSFVSSEAVLLDRHGMPLSEVRIDRRRRQLDWVPLTDLSPALSAALIAAEDKRFYEHDGVDWTGLVSAAWDNVVNSVQGKRVRGASTLSMQVAGMLDPALAVNGTSRSLGQKWDQARAAMTLEKTWSKREILEAYVNLASYRGELKGIDAAARGLFAKAASGLDARESAILIALLRGPNASPAIVAQRACAIAALVDTSAADGALNARAGNCDGIRATAMVTLAMPYRLAPRWNLAPHLAARLLQRGGDRLRSTLDVSIQRSAIDVLSEQLASLADRGVEDGAIIVLDNASGDVLAYVASSAELSAAPQVDGVLAPRQAGSSLKPFLYALALDDKLLTAASLVDDSEVAIATERGMYVPQNYDHDFRGLVSVRTALGNSLNIPAVRTLGLVGIDRFHERLRKLGFDTLTHSDDHYGAALALGGADVDLLSLANAYRALANGGTWSPARLVANGNARETRPVFGADASFIVADILADRSARAITFGFDNPLATRVWSAAKTGTSKDMRDNWCIGFTSRFTVGVWVGNFSGAPMRDVSGVTGAAPIWHAVVEQLHRETPSQAPVPPLTLVERSVRFDPPVEAERREWFMAGTAMTVVRSSSGNDSANGTASSPRIRYPAADTIVALDPDIPPRHQRVVFQASPSAADLRWRLDEHVLDATGPRLAWSPTRGRHALVLENDEGVVLSSVQFEVR